MERYKRKKSDREKLSRRGFGAGALGGLAFSIMRPVKKLRAAAPVSAREADHYETVLQSQGTKDKKDE